MGITMLTKEVLAKKVIASVKNASPANHAPVDGKKQANHIVHNVQRERRHPMVVLVQTALQGRDPTKMLHPRLA